MRAELQLSVRLLVRPLVPGQRNLKWRSRPSAPRRLLEVSREKAAKLASAEARATEQPGVHVEIEAEE